MERIVAIEGPLDLVRTVSGTAQWGGCSWIRPEENREGPGADAVWYAARSPDGQPGTVRLAAVDGHLVARAWGPGGAWLLDGAAALAGLHDDPSRLQPLHPIVREMQRQRHGQRIGSTGQVYPTLVAAILAQKVTGKESRAQLVRIARAWGERAPGPRDDLWILPAPGVLAEQPYYRFHPLGIERKRAQVVIEAARRARRLEEAATMPYDAASRRLQALSGVGPWTAGVVLAEALGDPDAVPIGDYHLPNVVAWHLAGEPRADDARMLELLAPYAGQRGRVARLLKAAGSAPKWGPRSEVRDIRDL